MISGNIAFGVDMSDVGATGNLVAGNRIGTTADGTTALPNGGGLVIGGDANTVGGTVAGASNLISGNEGNGVEISGVGNLVVGNQIGTDLAGTIAVANSIGVILGFAPDNTIGGTAPGAGNLISGNTNRGVSVEGSGPTSDLIEGNRIGTDATGTAALSDYQGVVLESPGNTVGGTAAGASNLISGNAFQGVGIGVGGGRQPGRREFDRHGRRRYRRTGQPGRRGNRIERQHDRGHGRGRGERPFGWCVRHLHPPTGNLIEGNRIGTDGSGATAIGNATGVEVHASGNTIGGDTTGAGNLISGNTNDGIFLGSDGPGNLVVGDSIGTNASGTASLANITGVAINSSGNTIGGVVSGARNLISGNSVDGVLLNEADNLVEGNRFGTDAAGDAAVPNGGAGVSIASTGNTIGGTTQSAGNLLSGQRIRPLRQRIGERYRRKSDRYRFDWHNRRRQHNERCFHHSGGVKQHRRRNDRRPRQLDLGQRGLGDSRGRHREPDRGQPDRHDVGRNSLTRQWTGSVRHRIGEHDWGHVCESKEPVERKRGLWVFITGSLATGNVVAGNYVGTDLDGAVPQGNSFNGILIDSRVEQYDRRHDRGARNLIAAAPNQYAGVEINGSGTSANVIAGNYIGTNADGAAAIATYNGVAIVNGASNNTIGGQAAESGNLIAGYSAGVYIANTSGNVVQGNRVGTNAAGTASLGDYYGVDILEASGNTIGGASPGAGNLISGNTLAGLVIEFAAAADNLVEGNLIGTDPTGTVAVPNGNGVIVSSAGNTIGGAATARATSFPATPALALPSTQRTIWLRATASALLRPATRPSQMTQASIWARPGIRSAEHRLARAI